MKRASIFEGIVGDRDRDGGQPLAVVVAERQCGLGRAATGGVCTGIRAATGAAYENRGAAFLDVRHLPEFISAINL